MMKCSNMIFGALKTQYIPAHGNALGNETKMKLSPERARQKHGAAGYDYVTPLSAIADQQGLAGLKWRWG